MTTKSSVPKFKPVDPKVPNPIKLGDQAHVTDTNGDTHTFTVTAVDSVSGRIADASGRTYAPNAGTWEVAPRDVTLPNKPGVYLPFFYQDGRGTPNIWLLDNYGSWIELANVIGIPARKLDLARIEDNIGTMVYLGTGSADQKVVPNV